MKVRISSARQSLEIQKTLGIRNKNANLECQLIAWNIESTRDTQWKWEFRVPTKSLEIQKTLGILNENANFERQPIDWKQKTLGIRSENANFECQRNSWIAENIRDTHQKCEFWVPAKLTMFPKMTPQKAPGSPKWVLSHFLQCCHLLKWGRN